MLLGVSNLAGSFAAQHSLALLHPVFYCVNELMLSDISDRSVIKLSWITEWNLLVACASNATAITFISRDKKLCDGEKGWVVLSMVEGGSLETVSSDVFPRGFALCSAFKGDVIRPYATEDDPNVVNPSVWIVGQSNGTLLFNYADVNTAILKPLSIPSPPPRPLQFPFPTAPALPPAPITVGDAGSFSCNSTQATAQPLTDFLVVSQKTSAASVSRVGLSGLATSSTTVDASSVTLTAQQSCTPDNVIWSSGSSGSMFKSVSAVVKSELTACPTVCLPGSERLVAPVETHIPHEEQRRSGEVDKYGRNDAPELDAKHVTTMSNQVTVNLSVIKKKGTKTGVDDSAGSARRRTSTGGKGRQRCNKDREEEKIPGKKTISETGRRSGIKRNSSQGEGSAMGKVDESHDAVHRQRIDDDIQKLRQTLGHVPTSANDIVSETMTLIEFTDGLLHDLNVKLTVNLSNEVSERQLREEMARHRARRKWDKMTECVNKEKLITATTEYRDATLTQQGSSAELANLRNSIAEELNEVQWRNNTLLQHDSAFQLLLQQRKSLRRFVQSSPPLPPLASETASAVRWTPPLGGLHQCAWTLEHALLQCSETPKTTALLRVLKPLLCNSQFWNGGDGGRCESSRDQVAMFFHQRQEGIMQIAECAQRFRSISDAMSHLMHRLWSSRSPALTISPLPATSAPRSAEAEPTTKVPLSTSTRRKTFGLDKWELLEMDEGCQEEPSVGQETGTQQICTMSASRGGKFGLDLELLEPRWSVTGRDHSSSNKNTDHVKTEDNGAVGHDEAPQRYGGEGDAGYLSARESDAGSQERRKADAGMGQDGIEDLFRRNDSSVPNEYFRGECSSGNKPGVDKPERASIVDDPGMKRESETEPSGNAALDRHWDHEEWSILDNHALKFITSHSARAPHRHAEELGALESEETELEEYFWDKIRGQKQQMARYERQLNRIESLLQQLQLSRPAKSQTRRPSCVSSASVGLVATDKPPETEGRQSEVTRICEVERDRGRHELERAVFLRLLLNQKKEDSEDVAIDTHTFDSDDNKQSVEDKSEESEPDDESAEDHEVDSGEDSDYRLAAEGVHGVENLQHVWLQSETEGQARGKAQLSDKHESMNKDELKDLLTMKTREHSFMADNSPAKEVLAPGPVNEKGPAEDILDQGKVVAPGGDILQKRAVFLKEDEQHTFKLPVAHSTSDSAEQPATPVLEAPSSTERTVSVPEAEQTEDVALNTGADLSGVEDVRRTESREPFSNEAAIPASVPVTGGIGENVSAIGTSIDDVKRVEGVSFDDQGTGSATAATGAEKPTGEDASQSEELAAPVECSSASADLSSPLFSTPSASTHLSLSSIFAGHVAANEKQDFPVTSPSDMPSSTDSAGSGTVAPSSLFGQSTVSVASVTVTNNNNSMASQSFQQESQASSLYFTASSSFGASLSNGVFSSGETVSTASAGLFGGPTTSSDDGAWAVGAMDLDDEGKQARLRQLLQGGKFEFSKTPQPGTSSGFSSSPFLSGPFSTPCPAPVSSLGRSLFENSVTGPFGSAPNNSLSLGYSMATDSSMQPETSSRVPAGMFQAIETKSEIAQRPTYSFGFGSSSFNAPLHADPPAAAAEANVQFGGFSSFASSSSSLFAVAAGTSTGSGLFGGIGFGGNAGTSFLASTTGGPTGSSFLNSPAGATTGGMSLNVPAFKPRDFDRMS
eukprot:GHVQ01009101.1.p1 GENE.GHVQ01009101.1~~GHVQ01009101.1.p1  ORF type:complete len:1698 (+),score=273.70 GHVQ01009101.1:1320-6413(+)